MDKEEMNTSAALDFFYSWYVNIEQMNMYSIPADHISMDIVLQGAVELFQGILEWKRIEG